MQKSTAGNELDGRVALVTGAGRGLGQAIAVELAQYGARTILVSRTREQLEETSAAISAAGLPGTEIIQADLEDIDALPDLADKLWGIHGRIDIVVYVAGKQLRQPAISVTAAEMHSILGLNLVSPFIMGSALGKLMMEHQIAGRHIFIASLASSIGLPNIVPYGASKSGILGVVRGLAREWAAHRITVNAVAPGYIETELTKPLLSDENRRAQLLERIPMGRFGSPQDVAGVCRFLASDDAAYITGQTIVVDGGWLSS